MIGKRITQGEAWQEQGSEVQDHLPEVWHGDRVLGIDRPDLYQVCHMGLIPHLQGASGYLVTASVPRLGLAGMIYL